MKIITHLFILFLILFSGCKTIKPAVELNPETERTSVADVTPSAVNFSDQETWLLGYISPGQFTRDPYSTWYLKGINDYQPNSDAINDLMKISKDDLTITIVLGTWCPDSRREVPRFMKILDTWQFSLENITFIGVDNVKLSPLGEYDKLDIQRVPTFIIYKKNIEAGRIIEVPGTSLEQDMVNILTRNEN